MPIRLNPRDMTRRAVLEAGLAAGAFGLSGASLLFLALAPRRRRFRGTHRIALGCIPREGEGGRFVGIRPWEKDPHPAPVLEGVMDSVYSPTRIKYPMVRRAFLEHGHGADPEGEATEISSASPGTRRSTSL